MSDVERYETLGKIVEKLAELRGIKIDAAFKRDGLGELITEPLPICEGEVTIRPNERRVVRILVRRWRALENHYGSGRPTSDVD
jgi:hypothetical protein